ncbi:MAG: stage III sporulation protein AC/AD protein family [Ruminiclostridium sp.]|nr:stage III sporulation protein AC/AD protein family [Ruminiclostridium sp.]
MNIFAIIGTGIIAAAISAVLKRFGGEFGLFVSLAASLLILYAVLSAIDPLTELIGELAEASGTDSAYIAVLMKALAVCVITQLAAESCRDSGEGAIASKIEFAGKTAVLLISVPLFSAIFGIVKELIL